MKKKILGIFVSLLVIAMLATPVMAEPTQGQKTAVSLVFNFPPISTTIIDEWYTNGVMHRLWEVTFDVDLTIIDGPNLDGTAVVERKTVNIMPKGQDTGKSIVVDYYVFDFGAGGFEGNGLVLLDGFVAGTWEDTLIHGLFHGTGAFEGQTLNVRHQLGKPLGITGYWMNYEP